MSAGCGAQPSRDKARASCVRVGAAIVGCCGLACESSRVEAQPSWAEGFTSAEALVPGLLWWLSVVWSFVAKLVLLRGDFLAIWQRKTVISWWMTGSVRSRCRKAVTSPLRGRLVWPVSLQQWRMAASVAIERMFRQPTFSTWLNGPHRYRLGRGL